MSAVHLQILLLVGLIVFCLCLALGCFLCWKKSQFCGMNQKDLASSAQSPTEPLNFAQTPPPSAVSSASGQQYEELDGDVLEYPSTFTSPAFSQSNFPSLELNNQAEAASEEKEQTKHYFSLRRLSTPPLTPLYQPIYHNHAALHPFPKLGLLAKTRKALQRRCTVAGSLSYDEHSRLTSPGAVSPSMPEEPIPLAQINYGSNASCQEQTLPKPCLHFTMAFSSEQQTLAVSILRLTGTSHRLENLSVLGSLQPLYPCPIQASVQRGFDPESLSLLLLLKVSSEKELQRCVLRIVVYTREPPSLRGSTLGEVEAECGGRDWRVENPLHFTEALNPNRWSLKKVRS